MGPTKTVITLIVTEHFRKIPNDESFVLPVEPAEASLELSPYGDNTLVVVVIVVCCGGEGDGFTQIHIET